MVKTSRPSSIPRPLLLGLKIAATVLAIWLIARKVDFSHMGGQLANAHLGWFALCIALQFVVAALNAARWKLLVGAPDVTLRKYLYYVFVGYFFTAFLPSAALAEGMRTYAFGKRYGKVQKNFVAMLFGRAVGLVAAACVAAGFGLAAMPEIAALPLWSGLRLRPESLWIGAAAAVALGALGAAFFRARLASAWSDLRGFLLDFRMLAFVLLVSLAIQFAMLLAVLVLFRSLGWELAYWQAAFIPVAVQVLLLLPVSFGGVGVREYLNLMLYGQLAAVPAATVLAASLLAYAPVIALAAAGGLWMLYRRREPGETEAAG